MNILKTLELNKERFIGKLQELINQLEKKWGIEPSQLTQMMDKLDNLISAAKEDVETISTSDINEVLDILDEIEDKSEVALFEVDEDLHGLRANMEEVERTIARNYPGPSIAPSAPSPYN